MKKALIIFFVAFAVILFALGVYSRTSVDILDLQWHGFSHAEALSIKADAYTTSYYLFFVSHLCACMAYITKKKLD